jgi:hypothetical protein
MINSFTLHCSLLESDLILDEHNQHLDKAGGDSTPKSCVSEARLRILELTPVQNCLVVDR